MKSLVQIFIGFLLVTSSIVAQNGVIVPPKELVVEGVPPVPAALLPTIKRYMNVYGYPLAGWHPSKREVWIKGFTPDAILIAAFETPNSEPKTVKEIPAGNVYDVYTQPQGNYIVYNKDTDGDENFQLYLYDTKAKTSILLSSEGSRNVEPVWSNSGDRIIYGHTPPKGSGVDLYVMNPLDPKSNRLLVPSKGRMLEVFDWAPDDRKAVFVENISNESQGVLWMVDVATGEKNLLTPKAGSEVGSYYDSPQFGKDGNGVYVSTDHDSEFRRLAYLELATKQYKYLTDHIKWNVSEFKLAPDGKTVAFVINEDGISRLHLLDTKTEQEKQVRGLPIGIISNLHWHNNSIDLAFSFESARTPTDIFALNARTEKIEPWAKGVTNGLDAEKFAEPHLIRWPSFDGRQISGFLYRPPATFKGKRPVIIDIHGGPDSQFQPRFLFEGNYFINELGIVKIYPNVRGSAGYGRTFLRLDDGTRRTDAVKDIGALLGWIKKQPDLDAERVMVQGGSYGGYMALSVAMIYGARIRAALSDSGMSNLATYVERTESWRRDTRRIEYGDERDPKTREFLDRTAPLTNAEKINKPVMIVQGERDPRVKASESKQVVQSLRKHNPNVWFLLGMNEGHFFAQPVNREFQLLTTVLFVKQHLLKPEQVSRYSPQPSAP